MRQDKIRQAVKARLYWEELIRDRAKLTDPVGQLGRATDLMIDTMNALDNEEFMQFQHDYKKETDQ